MGERTSPTLVIETPTPVGSGRLFMHFSSNCRTDVLTHSGLPLTLLFRYGLLIITLRTRTVRMALSTFFSLFILAQVPSVASIAQRVESNDPCARWKKLSSHTSSECERDTARRLPRLAGWSVERTSNHPRQASGAYLWLWQGLRGCNTQVVAGCVRLGPKRGSPATQAGDTAGKPGLQRLLQAPEDDLGQGLETQQRNTPGPAGSASPDQCLSLPRQGDVPRATSTPSGDGWPLLAYDG